MSRKRLYYSGVLAVMAAPTVLRGQEKPLSINATFATGYYNTATRGETNESLSFVPVGAKFELSGYLFSPELLSFSAQPQVNLGPQASEAGFQGGNGIQFTMTLFRKRIFPLTFRYANVQVEDVYFGSLTQVSGYTLKNRTKDLGLTWELHSPGLPQLTLDWGTGSVDSTSAAAGISDYLSHGDHLNVDGKWERGGWDLEGFVRRHRQESELLAATDSGTSTGSLSETGVQYQGSARRSFFRDSELYVDAGSQSTSSLLFTLPIDLNTRYASANLRLFQRRRWKTSLRATYSSNLASQMLEQAANTLGAPGAVVPDASVLAPFTHGMANLNLNGLTSVALGHGLDLFGSVERSAILSSSGDDLLNSHYFTTSAGVTYTRRLRGGSISGEYARDFGIGSLTGQSGTIQGQHYMVSAQHGGPGGMQFDATVRGSDQSIQTAQPLTNNSVSAEGSVADRVAGNFSARLGGGWQWSSIVNAANEFRTNGYTARIGIEHPRFQLGASLNNSLSNSLPFYSQLLDGLGPASAAVVPLQATPSDYRAMSFNLHANPVRKVELSIVWTNSRQHLAGVVSNDFQLLNVFATYHFRKVQFELGFVRSNQSFQYYPDTERQRFYLRILRSAKLL